VFAAAKTIEPAPPPPPPLTDAAAASDAAAAAAAAATAATAAAAARLGIDAADAAAAADKDTSPAPFPAPRPARFIMLSSAGVDHPDGTTDAGVRGTAQALFLRVLGRAVQVDSFKTHLESAYESALWEYNVMNCFQRLLLISTCAATAGRRAAGMDVLSSTSQLKLRRFFVYFCHTNHPESAQYTQVS